MQADLNPLFNWNVKQLFLYLTAEYETPNNQLNQVRVVTSRVRTDGTAREVHGNSSCRGLTWTCENNELCGLVQPICWAGVASFGQTNLLLNFKFIIFWFSGY